MKRHWHNRGRIMTTRGLIWVTNRVAIKSCLEQSNDGVGFAGHLQSIELAYRKSLAVEPAAGNG